MRQGFVWLATFLAFPIAGAPLLAHAAYRRLGLLSRFGLSCAVGCLAVTTAMTVSTFLRFPWHPALLVLEAGILCAGLRLLVGLTAAGPVPRKGRPLDPLEWIALGVIAISLFAATLAAASASATSADLFLFWGPKAIAFANARGVDAAYLREPLLKYQHLSYPPLVPNAYAFASLVAGHFPWMAAVMTFPLFLGVLVVALPGLLRESCVRRSALVASAATAASLALIGSVYVAAGNADIFLLLFEVMAVAVLLGAEGPDRASYLLAGLLLAGATAAKVEGLPFALVTGLLFLVCAGSRGNVRRAGAAALVLGPTAVVIGIWFAFEKLRLNFLGYESYGPFFDADWRSLGRVTRTVAHALAQAGGGLPWLVPAIAAGAAISRAREWMIPVAIGALLSAFFLFTYLHGGDPTLWIAWSAGRVFAVVSPLLVMASVAGHRADGQVTGRSKI